MLPRAVRAQTVCTPSQFLMMRLRFPMDTVEYGFPQRDWMKLLLPEALPATTLEVLVNPTDETANDMLKGEVLPMNATIASNLVLSAMLLSRDFIPLVGAWQDSESNELEYNTKKNVSAAVRVGILPPDQSTSDVMQRDHFVKKVGPFLAEAFSSTENMTLTDIPMTFSRVDIASNITFEAVALEIDVLPEVLVEVVNEKNGTRYMNSGSYMVSSTEDTSFSCDPWPARCVFKKRDPPLKTWTIDADMGYDAAPQIQAYSICLNDNGTEAMQSTLGDGYPFQLNVQPCSRTSSTSMLLLSVGKRITVEALIENVTANATGIYQDGLGVATNMRKIYSLTVGRLSWTTSDIAKEFSATCDVGSGQTCEGLVLELNESMPVAARQRLAISADALPLDALLQPMLNNFMLDNAYRQRPLTLVQVNEPQRPPEEQLWYNVAAGDILHPHNVGNLTWDLSKKSPGYMCVFEEERVQRVLDNHMYIEYPLQATYTAAVFFLFQNAVVKDAVVIDEHSLTLAFDGNIQQVALWISIPGTNSLLTLLGCALLTVGIAATLVWASMLQNSPDKTNPLQGITDGEMIARVKLDDKTFPSVLLHRHVTAASHQSGKEPLGVDQFLISSLSLREHKSQAEQGTDVV